MTRAGKEPAEDAKRAIRRAFEVVGLETREVRMFKSSTSEGRIVLGTASPTGWPHELPAIELLVWVGFDGSVGEADIRCAATDGDPLMESVCSPASAAVSLPAGGFAGDTEGGVGRTP